MHAGSHLITHAGVRVPLAVGFAIAAAGMLLLSGVSAGGSYAADVLPGMLVAGLGLGIVLVSVSVSVLTGAGRARVRDALRPEHDRPRDRRLARDRGPGHDRRRRGRPERRGRAAIGDAFLAAAVIAGVAGVAALVILPSARIFLPKLALAPRVAVH